MLTLALELKLALELTLALEIMLVILGEEEILEWSSAGGLVGGGGFVYRERRVRMPPILFPVLGVLITLLLFFLRRPRPVLLLESSSDLFSGGESVTLAYEINGNPLRVQYLQRWIHLF